MQADLQAEIRSSLLKYRVSIEKHPLGVIGPLDDRLSEAGILRRTSGTYVLAKNKSGKRNVTPRPLSLSETDRITQIINWYTLG